MQASKQTIMQAIIQRERERPGDVDRCRQQQRDRGTERNRERESQRERKSYTDRYGPEIDIVTETNIKKQTELQRGTYRYIQRVREREREMEG